MLGELAPAQVDVVANGAVLAACAAGHRRHARSVRRQPRRAARTATSSSPSALPQLTTWTFARRSFIVTSATPPSRAQGTSAQTVVLTGDGFVAGATAKVSGPA